MNHKHGQCCIHSKQLKSLKKVTEKINMVCVGVGSDRQAEMLISEPVHSQVFQVLWGKQSLMLPSTCDVFHQIKDIRQRLTAPSDVRLNVHFPSSQGNKEMCFAVTLGREKIIKKKRIVLSGIHLNPSQISCSSQASIQCSSLKQVGTRCVSRVAQ